MDNKERKQKTLNMRQNNNKKEEESINLRASVQFMTDLTKWERKASKTKRSPGARRVFKITGVLVDNTSYIGFVS